MLFIAYKLQPEEESEFAELAARPDLSAVLLNSVAPAICGLESKLFLHSGLLTSLKM